MGQKRRATEDYESDGGFIKDAPRSKKTRAVAKSLEKQKDDDGNVYWEISRTRRVQISDFKGATMLGIREFYEKDDKMLPGKKGISLSLDQFHAVIELLPQIESELKTKGHDLPRPAYTSNTVSPPGDASDVEEEEEEDVESAKQESKVNKSVRPRNNNFSHKGNHEATSDEDDG